MNKIKRKIEFVKEFNVLIWTEHNVQILTTGIIILTEEHQDRQQSSHCLGVLWLSVEIRGRAVVQYCPFSPSQY
jgi:hypothetical protein